MRTVLCLCFMLVCSSGFAADVRTQKSSDGWRLLVDGKPFFIKGMCYSPTLIGEDANDGTRRNWLVVDDDRDGRNDFAYQAWEDTDRNNRRDGREKSVGDFGLMRRMGVNTIRVYHQLHTDPGLQKINAATARTANRPPDFPLVKEKRLFNDLYRKYGVRVAMGDLLGAYTVSTGADWASGTDYTDPVQRAWMLRSVEEMVRAHKDEPYLLLWILGNENELEATHTNAARAREAYARLLNEAALLIKRIDGHHPVALCLGGNAYWMFKELAQFAPDIDIFGVNLYQADGFRELWGRVAGHYDRPVLLTEFGTGTQKVVGGRIDEEDQARVHRVCWEDIARHQAGREKPGNAIGGFVYAWVDEWWPSGDAGQQNPGDPATGSWNFEYNGVTSLGDGTGGSLGRQLRKVYATYREMWRN